MTGNTKKGERTFKFGWFISWALRLTFWLLAVLELYTVVVNDSASALFWVIV